MNMGCCNGGYHEFNLDWFLERFLQLEKEWCLEKEDIDYIKNYFKNLDVSGEINDIVQQMINDGRFEVAVKGKTNYYDLGELSNFRIAYRCPDMEMRDSIIAECIVEKSIFHEYQWVYYTESSEFKNVPNTIPLYEKDNPENVLNVNGKGTSCSTTLCNILYNLGYTDLEGRAKWADANTAQDSFPQYLADKNWIPITNKNDLIKGDIVFVGYANYPDSRQYNPSHCFVYNGYVNGNLSSYDFGNTTLIQNNSINDFVWNLSGPQTWSVRGGALFRCYANSDMSDVGDNLWIGLSFENQDGTQVFQRMFNTNNLMVVYQIKTTDSSVSWSYRRFPVNSYNTWKGLTIYTKVYESGVIGFKINGTLTEEIGNTSGQIDYTIFSFNTFSDYKFINDVFNDFMIVDGVQCRVGTVTENNITTVHLYMDSATLSAGTEVHYHRAMFLR